MKYTTAVALFGLFVNSGYAADSWVHTGAQITGFNVKADSLVVYFKGGVGPCGGNGEFPFVIQKTIVGDQYQSMQSAVMLAYASNRLVSIYGSTCETVKSLRVFDPNTSFGNAGN